MSSIRRRLVLRNHYRRLVRVGRMPYAVANCPADRSKNGESQSRVITPFISTDRY